MNRKLEFSIDEFYHLYNRGNDKRIIFKDDRDRDRAIKLLFLCNSTKPVDIANLLIPEGLTFWEVERGGNLVNIGAYCLMPNHFHLLVHETIDGGISLFMQKFATAYSMYFNKRYKRTGKLFEGVFRATHANKDKYLNYLFAYIHLNPIKLIDRGWKEGDAANLSRAKRFLANYKYSSYSEYLNGNKIKARPESDIINKSAFPEYFATAKEFKDLINDWLSYSISQE